MKHLGLILFSIIVLASCKKDGESGCISQITGIAPVSAANNSTILALLKNNNLSAGNQVFTSYSTYNGSGQTTAIYQYAQSVQVRNGLPLFYSNLYYTFLNGASQGINGRIYYSAVALNTKSSLSLGTLKQLFVNEAINKQGLDPTFKDSCYVVQFGYFNANLYTNDTTANFVKAWEVHPKNSDFPQCYINDANSSTLYFDDGIRFLAPKN